MVSGAHFSCNPLYAIFVNWIASMALSPDAVSLCIVRIRISPFFLHVFHGQNYGLETMQGNFCIRVWMYPSGLTGLEFVVGFLSLISHNFPW